MDCHKESIMIILLIVFVFKLACVQNRLEEIKFVIAICHIAF